VVVAIYSCYSGKTVKHLSETAIIAVIRSWFLISMKQECLQVRIRYRNLSNSHIFCSVIQLELLIHILQLKRYICTLFFQRIFYCRNHKSRSGG